ncbi:MAG TPA: VapE domain-containing protein [Flavipsychrobacter sp.]|nr:VapE domain-containing protein [Flavipsychrobacter sp.]
MKNEESILNSLYEFRYNIISNNIEFKPKGADCFKKMDDYDLNSILRHLRKKYPKLNRRSLHELFNSDFVRKYNPFREYFDQLPEWNYGMPDYIKMLTDTIEVNADDKSTWEIYLQRWIIGVVACALSKEKANQQVLVLIGKQGIGKTTWLQNLLPKKLYGYYYSGYVNLNDKDSKINLAETLLINLDELENLNNNALGDLKTYITLPIISVRRPYAYGKTTLIRRASLMGSVNNTSFLRDKLGNRRYLCMECKNIKYQHDIDMDLVYSQALKLYKDEVKFWFDGQDIDLIDTHNAKYLYTAEEMEIITEYFSPVTGDEEPDAFLTIVELSKIIQEKSGINITINKLGSIMRNSEFKRTKRDGKWLYKLKSKSLEEVVN